MSPDIRHDQPVLTQKVGDNTHERTHSSRSHRFASIDGDAYADRVGVVPYDVRPLSMNRATEPHLAAFFDDEVVADI